LLVGGSPGGVRNRTRAASSTSLGSDYVDGGEPCIPRAR